MLPQFKEFKKLTLEDKDVIEELTKKFPSYSEFNFTNLYSYNPDQECEVCILNDNLIVKMYDYITQKPFITFLGSNDVQDTIQKLLAFAQESNIEATLRLVPEVNIVHKLKDLEQDYILTIDQENFDYILSADQLKNIQPTDATSDFKKVCPLHEVKILALDNKDIQNEIYNLFIKWAVKHTKTEEEVNIELTAIKRLLQAAKHLKLVAIGIYSNCELIGFTINEVIQDNQYIGHFKKVDETFPGLLQYLENTTAIQMGSYGCRFVNYQNDIGTPVKPIQYLKKYTIEKKLTTTIADGAISPEITQAMYKRNMELLHERRHAEDLLYNISEGVLAIDTEFKVILFNHTLEIMLNVPEKDVIGKNLTDIISITTQKGEPIDLAKYCFPETDKENSLSEVLLKGKDHDYYVNVKFSLITAEDEKKDKECLITMSDITKEILLDRAKDDFLSLASHELRTPMTVIKSYLSMLEDAHAENLTDKQKLYLERAATSTNDLIKLISDMLNISRMEQGRLTFDLKPVSLVEMINDSLEGLELKAQEKNIFLKTEYDKVEPTTVISTDTTKFKEILVNLVGNAIKFTKTGGVTVKVQTENNENEIKISVIDTGSGITSTEGEKLFQKFGRTQGSYERAGESGGTGLGLYIVKLYVESMGGRIGYFSEGENKGTTFWYTTKIEKANL